MQAPPPEKYTYPERVPESTCDVNLKRARVVDNDGNSYIRVTGTVTSSDLDPIKEALGEPTDTSSDNTVIGLLKKIDVKQFGVGQSYPGSTGGEIFNYYGTDANKNVASGDYSTAMGRKNKATAPYAFAAGNGNKVESNGGYAMGNNNEVYIGGEGALGHNNHVSGNSSTAIGFNNTITDNYAFALGGYLTSSDTNQVVIGRANNPATDLTYPTVVIGVGDSDYDRMNAIECNYTSTKICNNLELVATSTKANKISDPISNPPSQSDMTLASEAYVNSKIQRVEANTRLSPGYTYSLGRDKGIAVVFFTNISNTEMNALLVNTYDMWSSFGMSQSCQVNGYTFTYNSSTLTYDNTNTDDITIMDVYYLGK